MATYAIGDVQGCYEELRKLLERLRFDRDRDRLWFVGDLVNRGPQSLEVLRFVKGLGERAVTVLGNHDLHLVAAALAGRARAKDTFQDVLGAPDAGALVRWLRQRPLLHVERGLVMVHAGLPAAWSVRDARRICAAASRHIAAPGSNRFFREHMYGDEPRRWSPSLAGTARLRYVINACTRLRVCSPEGDLLPEYKGPPDAAAGVVPWFKVRGRRSRSHPVLFGHWSLLGQVRWPRQRVYGLDTGCVWGGRLSALRLEDRRLFSVDAARRYSRPG